MPAHLALHELGELGERERRAVRLGHEQALEHRLVEVALGAAHQEAVQLQWGSEGSVAVSAARGDATNDGGQRVSLLVWGLRQWEPPLFSLMPLLLQRPSAAPLYCCC